MKKLILGTALLLCLASCSYRIYPVGTLADNYELSMKTAEEQAAKESVAIYLSENEVPGPYKLLAFVEHRPILPIAIADQQLKNFYKQAVLKAYEMGGNGIIVESIRSFKVIQVSGRPMRKAHQGLAPAPQTRMAPRTETARPAPSQREPAAHRETTPLRERIFRSEAPKRETEIRTEPAPKRETIVRSEPAPKRETVFKSEPKPKNESAPKKETAPKREPVAKSQPAVKTEPVQTKAEPVVAALDDDNPIFDESTVQWFTSGYVYRAKEQEQIEIIETMNDEILGNLQICKTLEEAHCISKKIDLLEKYNQALPVPSGTQTGKIKAFRNSLSKIMTDLNKGQTGSTAVTGNSAKTVTTGNTAARRSQTAKEKKSGGVIDGAVESVKGFFGKLKKK